MSQTKRKHPLIHWDQWNQNPDLAFTLVARNERARQMWAHPSNSSKYVAPFSVERTPEDQIIIHISGKGDDQRKLETNQDTEPALHFLFSDLPKNPAKGYVMGSDDKPCDVLLGDTDDYISGEMIFFNFNNRHQLKMDVKSDKPTSVKFKGQKLATRARFTWLFPRNRQMIRVKVANRLEFDVVLPDYGKHADTFHENCASFLIFAAQGRVIAHNPVVSGTAATEEASDTSTPRDPFYLRGMRVGRGSYGDVYPALRMPDGKVFAAKRFRDKESFQLELKMQKKLCQANHDNIVKFVGEWHGDRKPTLIMEYVAGGNLCDIMEQGMEFGEVGNLANQILLALKFVHHNDVMHWDVKPSNILCATRYQFILGDFGVALEFGTHTKPRGTLEYMAPEADLFKQHWYAADMWSLGVTLLECMVGLPDGDPKKDRQRWCRTLVKEFKQYSEKCNRMLEIYTGPTYWLLRLIMEAMLVMNRDQRRPAWECLENRRYPGLWEWASQWKDSPCEENSDPADRSQPSIQARSDWSFDANSLVSSRFDDTEDMTFETVSDLKDDEEAREGKGSKSEDSSTTVRRATSNPLVASDTSNPPVTSDKETYSVSATNKNAKRKRESGSSSTSSKGEAGNKTITPDESTPDHSENRTAEPGSQHGGNDSLTAVVASSSTREPKRTKLDSE